MEIELPAGAVGYEDSGGTGPVVVLLHGLLMDASLWSGVVAALPDHRCVAPTLPLGAHRAAMRAGADLSLAGQARLVLDLLDALDLRDVTLVGNDTGGAVAQLTVAAGGDRIGRLVLVSCDAFDDFPPGLPGRTIAALRHLSPGLFGAFMQQLRLRPARRLPIAFGWLTRRGDATVRGWLGPILTSRAIRRETVRMLRAVFADRTVLTAATDQLAGFDRPALVVWAGDERVMRRDNGRRLVDLLPRGHLIEIPDSYTLVPLDQPAALADAITEFVAKP
jgi:pimeloyl-ACP methyl ester carboxylesterase